MVRALAILVALTLLSCTDVPASLNVRVRTDYVPFAEFVWVHEESDGLEQIERPVAYGDDFMAG